jgi:glycosyltransferase involved in cell wall biosynthesis
VSDGSTDRTAQIAGQFDDVQVIVFESNRGYGAAIKAGWESGTGELLGFLDADGTCDPLFFADLCRTSIAESADVVLGSRLGPGSKMPRIRRIGNQIYAFLLGMACGNHVTDTASGMRVVRRSSLKWLLPLPDGLHFTPSMSARALLNGLCVVEVPMSYEERIGESKLSVLHDGVRFLQTIFDGVLCYRPEKLLLATFGVCMLTVILLAAYPTEFYLSHRRLEEWMIYRFVVCQLVATTGLLLLNATALTSQMSHFGPRRDTARTFWSSLIGHTLQGWTLAAIVAGVGIAGIAFLWPGLTEFVRTGGVTLHWSRLLAGAFSLFACVQTCIFALLSRVLTVWRQQRTAGAVAPLQPVPKPGTAGRYDEIRTLSPVETSK